MVAEGSDSGRRWHARSTRQWVRLSASPRATTYLLRNAIDGEVDEFEGMSVRALHAGAWVDVPDRCLTRVIYQQPVFSSVGDGGELADLDSRDD